MRVASIHKVTIQNIHYFSSDKIPCRFNRLNVILRTIILPLGLFGLNQAWAASPVDLAALQRQNDVILQQQQDQIRQDQENARRAIAPSGASLKTPDMGKTEPVGPCRDIQEIVINGADHLSKTTIKHIVQAYQGRCLAANDIEALLTQITGAYFSRGYITSRAYLPAQDLKTGKLTITVVEGVVERYQIEGPAASRIWPYGVFPSSSGSLLNLRDIEQGIDQINRASSNNARLDIQPGSKAGESVVVVQNPSTFPLHLLTSFDNQSVAATGRESGMVTITEDGLLHANEVVSVTRRQTLPNNDNHFSRSNALNVSLPFGYSTLNFNVSSSAYNSLIHTPSGASLLSQGNTLTRSLGLDRVVYRDQDSRISVSGTLSTQRTDSYIASQFLDVASRSLTSFDAGVAGFTRLAGGIFNMRLDYVHGLTILDALNDPKGLPYDLPHAQFAKVMIDAGYDRPFSFMGQPLSWSSRLNAQTSSTSMFGSQQIIIGGPLSVRGFLNTSLSGDSGYYWRNELGMPRAFDLGGNTLNTRFYAGVDVGCVNNNAVGVPSGALSGITLGVSGQLRQFSGELSLSHELSQPAGTVRESGQVFFRLSYSN